MESKIKHLELIQGVINRLALNSFSVKGWSVTLVAALFALAAKDSNPKYVYVAYLPVITFWGLDGYFLMLERNYRRLYDDVRGRDQTAIDFSMNIGRGGLPDWSRATLLSPVNLFHLVLLVSLIGATVVSTSREAEMNVPSRTFPESRPKTLMPSNTSSSPTPARANAR
jgi:hypothetical protein